MPARSLPAIKRLLLALLLLAATILGPLANEAGASAPTGHEVATPFRAFFNANGAVEVFGLPLSGALIEDGRTVQYFERSRLEYHPEFAGTQDEVMLGLLGRALTVGRNFPGGTPDGRGTYFAQTGHNLGGAFRDYWLRHNGLRIFGYPISEEFAERSADDGQLRTVQYFERGRLEWHGEQGRVLVGRLGAQLFVQSYAAQSPTPDPSPLAVNQGPTPNAYEQRVLALLLEARGAPAPQLDPALIGLARERSADMANRNYFSHTTPEGANVFVMLNSKGIPWGTAGEIIARNNAAPGDTAALAARSYLNSPSHRAVVVDSQYNYVGVGHAVDGHGMHYFTLVFVRR